MRTKWRSGFCKALPLWYISFIELPSEIKNMTLQLDNRHKWRMMLLIALAELLAMAV